MKTKKCNRKWRGRLYFSFVVILGFFMHSCRYISAWPQSTVALSLTSGRGVLHPKVPWRFPFLLSFSEPGIPCVKWQSRLTKGQEGGAVIVVSRWNMWHWCRKEKIEHQITMAMTEKWNSYRKRVSSTANWHMSSQYDFTGRKPNSECPPSSPCSIL